MLRSWPLALMSFSDFSTELLAYSEIWLVLANCRRSAEAFSLIIRFCCNDLGRGERRLDNSWLCLTCEAADICDSHFFRSTLIFWINLSLELCNLTRKTLSLCSTAFQFSLNRSTIGNCGGKRRQTRKCMTYLWQSVMRARAGKRQLTKELM